MRMNPVLLKPSSDTGNQLIVNRRGARKRYRAAEYFKMKKPGAGSCALMRGLRRKTTSSSSRARAASGDQPAGRRHRQYGPGRAGERAGTALMGDIDRAACSAQLYGTVALLQPEERARVVSTVINKFRGDVGSCFAQTLRCWRKDGRARAGRRALYPRGHRRRGQPCAVPCQTSLKQRRPLDIAVVPAAHLQFTDFSPLESHPRWACGMWSGPGSWASRTWVVLPGTKNTMGRPLPGCARTDWRPLVKKLAAAGYAGAGRVRRLPDAGNARWTTGRRGAGRPHGRHGPLPCATRFTGQKVRTRVQACAASNSVLRARSWTASEIHMGRTGRGGTPPFCLLADGTPEGRGGRQCVRHLSARPV